jgi:GAF domain-containing protein
MTYPLLEGHRVLAASAIANARLMDELRHYGEQQRGLYEMSQQIAAGLDLPSTLNRTLSWVGRLLNTEVGLLWLIDEAGRQLELVSALGVDPAQEQRLVLSLAVEESLCSWAVQHRQSIFINNPTEDTRINCQIVRQLGLDLHNALVVPISYNGQLIGVLSLLNKIGGPFTPADETLLTTAAEIVAVAISNARLHTQTIAFMAERERLHQQVLQSERLAIIGRLTASLSHEINNPMQAIQGALALALEEMNDAEALVTYITMSQRESERVVQLINRLRQIYRPATDPQPEAVSLNLLLKDAALMVRKELSNQKVKFRPGLADALPPVRAIVGQIHLVLLNLLLDLSQAIGQAGGGELAVRSYGLGQTVCLEFSTQLAFVTRLNWTCELAPGGGPSQPELGFDVPLSRDIIQAHGGAIRYATEGQRAIYTVELPIFQPMPTAAPTLPFPEKL